MINSTTDSLSLNHYLPYQLANLAKRVSDACNAEYGAPYDISVAEWRLLARLGEHEELHSRGLGDTTFMDKSRVSRAIKQLEGKGYLVRRVDAEDNRASYLSLTVSGRELYSQIVPRALDWEAELLSALERTEHTDLLRVIAKLEAKLEQMTTHRTGL
jgi:DNA-binding MarR family transcriptional regulator